MVVEIPVSIEPVSDWRLNTVRGRSGHVCGRLPPADPKWPIVAAEPSRAEPDRGEGLKQSRKTPPCSRYSDWTPPPPTPPVRRSRNAPKCRARQWGGGESRGQSGKQRSVRGGCLRPPSIRWVPTAQTVPGGTKLLRAVGGGSARPAQTGWKVPGRW